MSENDDLVDIIKFVGATGQVAADIGMKIKIKNLSVEKYGQAEIFLPIF